MYDSAKQGLGSQVDYGKIRGGLMSSSKQSLNLSNRSNKLVSATEVIREEEELPSSSRINHSGENDDEAVMINSMQ